MPDIMQIRELLKGYRVDRENIQSAGNMTVVPIVSDTEFTNVANIHEIVFKNDPSYGTLEFKNNSGDIGIVLQGWTMIDNKQNAQDRAIPYAHLIKAANAKLVPANCIQASQGGHFQKETTKDEDFMIMPPSLRGIALKSASNSYQSSDYSALWGPLGKWVKGVNCESGGLTNFYSKFEDRLDQFVAQFEPVEKQLGAIVLINGEVVAIDLMPRYDTWKKSWRPLIRDSYGAEAIRMTENQGATITHSAMEAQGIKSIDDLEKAFDDMVDDFYVSIVGIVNTVSQLSLAFRTLEQIDELTMLKFDNEQFIGQGVLHGDKHFVYLSLVSASAKPIQQRKKFQSLRNQPYSDNDFSFN